MAIELSPEDEQTLLLAKAKRLADERDAKAMDKIKFAAWSLRGIIVVTIIVTGFVLRTEWTFRDRNTRIEVLETWKAEHEKSVAIRDRLVDKAIDDFENFKKTFLEQWGPRAREHDYMWWMKQMRLTNKDVDSANVITTQPAPSVSPTPPPHP